MRLPAALAAVLLLAPAAQEDPLTLIVKPLRSGLERWERTGPEKAFTWTAAGEVLAIRGQSGKETPRILYRKAAWDRGELRFQAKRGSRKIRVVLRPEPQGAPVVAEFPRDAVKATEWSDLAVRVGGGKAALLSVDPDGKETEVGAADLPAGTRVRFGFEAPSGVDATLTGVRLVRPYEEAPPFAEEGFDVAFDGTTLNGWQVRPDVSPNVEVARGILTAETPVLDEGIFWYDARLYKAYELRFRALWPSTCLKVRAVEAIGKDGKVKPLDTIHLILTDHLDAEADTDVAIRVADGRCTVRVNGKQVIDDKAVGFEVTPVAFLVERGKKTLLRDIRIRDLAPGEGRTPGGSSGVPGMGGDGK
jgi:hypothetical protein